MMEDAGSGEQAWSLSLGSHPILSAGYVMAMFPFFYQRASMHTDCHWIPILLQIWRYLG